MPKLNSSALLGALSSLGIVGGTLGGASYLAMSSGSKNLKPNPWQDKRRTVSDMADALYADNTRTLSDDEWNQLYALAHDVNSLPRGDWHGPQQDVLDFIDRIKTYNQYNSIGNEMRTILANKGITTPEALRLRELAETARKIDRGSIYLGHRDKILNDINSLALQGQHRYIEPLSEQDEQEVQQRENEQIRQQAEQQRRQRDAELAREAREAQDRYEIEQAGRIKEERVRQQQIEQQVAQQARQREELARQSREEWNRELAELNRRREEAVSQPIPQPVTPPKTQPQTPLTIQQPKSTKSQPTPQQNGSSLWDRGLNFVKEHPGGTAAAAATLGALGLGAIYYNRNKKKKKEEI